MIKIKIVAVPPGEAPLQIREQWVDLVLPAEKLRSDAELVGVLTGRTQQRTGGYSVETATAVHELEKKSPEAALWWKRNLPGFCRHLVFDHDACVVIH